MSENSPMNPTDHEDELLRALAAADPSGEESPVEASTPQAQALLERILGQSLTTDRQQHPPSHPKEEAMSPQTPAGNPGLRPADNPGLRPAAATAPLAAVSGDDEVPLIDASTSGLERSNRGRGLMVAAAAAFVLVALAALTLVPINTTSAVAEVHSAAAATDAARAGRIDAVFDLDGSGTHADDTGAEVREDINLGGSVTMVYRGDDLQVSLDLDELAFFEDSDDFEDDAFGLDLAAVANDIRLVDGVVYIKPYGQWLAVETNGFLGSFVTDQVNPREVLTVLQELTDASEIGTTTLDGPLEGLSVTHYRSVVDLGDESLRSSGWVPFNAASFEADGEITVDTYVDDAGLLRRLVVSGGIEELTDTEGSEEGAVTFSVETTFTDLGEDVAIEAPEGAVLFGSDFLGELDEEVDA